MSESSTLLATQEKEPAPSHRWRRKTALEIRLEKAILEQRLLRLARVVGELTASLGARTSESGAVSERLTALASTLSGLLDRATALEAASSRVPEQAVHKPESSVPELAAPQHLEIPVIHEPTVLPSSPALAEPTADKTILLKPEEAPDVHVEVISAAPEKDPAPKAVVMPFVQGPLSLAEVLDAQARGEEGPVEARFGLPLNAVANWEIVVLEPSADPSATASDEPSGLAGPRTAEIKPARRRSVLFFTLFYAALIAGGATKAWMMRRSHTQKPSQGNGTVQYTGMVPSAKPSSAQAGAGALPEGENSVNPEKEALGLIKSHRPFPAGPTVGEILGPMLEAAGPAPWQTRTAADRRLWSASFKPYGNVEGAAASYDFEVDLQTRKVRPSPETLRLLRVDALGAMASRSADPEALRKALDLGGEGEVPAR